MGFAYSFIYSRKREKKEKRGIERKRRMRQNVEKIDGNVMKQIYNY